MSLKNPVRLYAPWALVHDARRQSGQAKSEAVGIAQLPTSLIALKTSGDSHHYIHKAYKNKRGNRRLRTLLIHGARAILKYCADKSDPLSRWLQALIE